MYQGPWKDAEDRSAATGPALRVRSLGRSGRGDSRAVFPALIGELTSASDCMGLALRLNIGFCSDWFLNLGVLGILLLPLNLHFGVINNVRRGGD